MAMAMERAYAYIAVLLLPLAGPADMRRSTGLISAVRSLDLLE